MSDDEPVPQEALHFATISTFQVQFYCHSKLMEVTHDDDRNFHLACDLCGKSIKGTVGESP